MSVPQGRGVQGVSTLVSSRVCFAAAEPPGGTRPLSLMAGRPGRRPPGAQEVLPTAVSHGRYYRKYRTRKSHQTRSRPSEVGPGEAAGPRTASCCSCPRDLLRPCTCCCRPGNPTYVRVPAGRGGAVSTWSLWSLWSWGAGGASGDGVTASAWARVLQGADLEQPPRPPKVANPWVANLWRREHLPS